MDSHPVSRAEVLGAGAGVRQQHELMKARPPSPMAITAFLATVVRSGSLLAVDLFYDWWKTTDEPSRRQAFVQLHDLARLPASFVECMCGFLQSDVQLHPLPVDLRPAGADGHVMGLRVGGDDDDVDGDDDADASEYDRRRAAERLWMHLCLLLVEKIHRAHCRRQSTMQTARIEALMARVRDAGNEAERRALSAALAREMHDAVVQRDHLAVLWRSPAMWMAVTHTVRAGWHALHAAGAVALGHMDVDTLLRLLNLTALVHDSWERLSDHDDDDNALSEEQTAMLHDTVHSNAVTRALAMVAGAAHARVPQPARMLALQALQNSVVQRVGADLFWDLARAMVELPPVREFPLAYMLTHLLVVGDRLPPTPALPPLFMARLLLRGLVGAANMVSWYQLVQGITEPSARYERLVQGTSEAAREARPSTVEMLARSADTTPVECMHVFCLALMRWMCAHDIAFIPFVFWTLLQRLPDLQRFCANKGSYFTDTMVALLRAPCAREDLRQHLRLCTPEELAAVEPALPRVVEAFAHQPRPEGAVVDALSLQPALRVAQLPDHDNAGAPVSVESFCLAVLEKEVPTHPFTNVALTWPQLQALNADW